MGEVTVPTTTESRPLAPGEIAALQQVKWANDRAPHPDGGTRRQFGLKEISTPILGGIEFIRVDISGVPVKEFVPKGGVIGDSEKDRYTRLNFANLRERAPISVYISSPDDVTEPLNPDRINEIGEFVLKVDKTFVLDDRSRHQLEVYEELDRMHKRNMEAGITDEDDETTRALAEQAAISLQLIRDSRKVLPQRVRDLVTHAEELGILLIDERYHSGERLQLDPTGIKAIYTPETDNLPEKKFTEHARKVFANMPALHI